MKYVTGIDLSLTATGIAVADLDGNTWYATTIKPPTRLTDLDRINWLTDQIIGHCYEAGLAVLEGPSYASAGRGQHERAGLWWIVKRQLSRRLICTAVAPPSSVKKYATGKGNAGKDAVLMHTVRRFPEFDGDNNAADALWLAAMGAERLTRAIVALPIPNKEALKGVAWPEVLS